RTAPRGAAVRAAHSCATGVRSLEPRTRPGRSPGSHSPELEHMVLPWKHVQVEPARVQLVALALMHRLPGQIPELPRAAREAGKRQPHVTLALMGGIVDRDQEPFGSGRLPRKGQEAVRSPVTFPCRRGFEKLPR